MIYRIYYTELLCGFPFISRYIDASTDSERARVIKWLASKPDYIYNRTEEIA